MLFLDFFPANSITVLLQKQLKASIQQLQNKNSIITT